MTRETQAPQETNSPTAEQKLTSLRESLEKMGPEEKIEFLRNHLEHIAVTLSGLTCMLADEEALSAGKRQLYQKFNNEMNVVAHELLELGMIEGRRDK